METKLEQWSVADKAVDLVLLFSVLFHVDRADREALFQQLFTRMAPNGVVAIVSPLPKAAIIRLVEGLGNPAKVFHDEMADKEMLAAGFKLVCKQDLKGPADWSQPLEFLVTLGLHLTDNLASEQEVRAAIDDLYGSFTGSGYFHKTLAIFSK